MRSSASTAASHAVVPSVWGATWRPETSKERHGFDNSFDVYEQARIFIVNPFPYDQLILDGRRVETSLTFSFTFYILFGMQNDQPSSSPIDRFAS